MQQAMKQMGIKQQELDAVEVVIRLQDKDIIIRNPQVAKVNMMGQDSFQISGTVVEQARSIEVEISEEDIKTVMDQANVDEEKAKEALTKTNGDIAEAILALQE